MPVLHRNSINGKFYLVTAFRGSPVTFHTKHWCHQNLANSNRRDGDEISWREFYDLWEAGALWTRSGRTKINQTDPLFTWAELEKKIADLSKQLVEMQIKNSALEANLTEERLKVSSLESDCHQWSAAYQALEADLNKAKEETALVVRRISCAEAQRNIALVLFVVAVLAVLGVVLRYFI